MADNAAIASNVVDEAIATLNRCRIIASPCEVVDDAISTLARCLSIAGHSDEPIPAAVEPNEEDAGSNGDAMEDNEEIEEETVEGDEVVGPEVDAAEPDEEPAESNVQCYLPDPDRIIIVPYEDESQLGEVKRLVDTNHAVPFSIYTCRYYIHNSPELCLLAQDSVTGAYVGTIVCQTVVELPSNRSLGFIEMLAVDAEYRNMGVGKLLVLHTIYNMYEAHCDEISLETAVSNASCLTLFLNLGFVKENRLTKCYSNGEDAFRLKLHLPYPHTGCVTQQEVAHCQQVAQ